jgi:hypothetical protein
VASVVTLGVAGGLLAPFGQDIAVLLPTTNGVGLARQRQQFLAYGLVGDLIEDSSVTS